MWLHAFDVNEVLLVYIPTYQHLRSINLRYELIALFYESRFQFCFALKGEKFISSKENARKC